MERRRDLPVSASLAVLLALVMATVVGCSRKLPTSSEVTVQGTGEPATEEPTPREPHRGPTAPVPAVTFLRPESIASIRKFPEQGLLDGGGSGGNGYAFSDYFRTTDMNREFRRGFAEFVIPGFRDVFSARIVLEEWRAGIAFPLPPDRHELSYYTDVDRVVGLDDYDRPMTVLTTFETDVNVHMQSFAFDETELVRRLRGSGLGLRIKLEADPDYMAMGFLGTGFSSYSSPPGIVIEITTTAVEANAYLRSVIQRMGLEPRIEGPLLARLRRVAAILGDHDPANDFSACDELSGFITEVRARRGELLLIPSSYVDLEPLATNLQTAIGCQ